MAFDAASFTNFTLPEAPTLPTTPKARVAYLRDFLRKLPNEKFDIQTISTPHECRSAACIAGWSVFLFGYDGHSNALHHIKDYRKLTQPPGTFDNNGRQIYTRLRAVRVLDIMLETWDKPGGPVVDWPRAIAEVPA